MQVRFDTKLLIVDHLGCSLQTKTSFEENRDMEQETKRKII